MMVSPTMCQEASERRHMLTRCFWYVVCTVLPHIIWCNSHVVGLQDERGIAASMLPVMNDSVDDDAGEEEGNHAGARGLDIEQGNQACPSLPLLKADLLTCLRCAMHVIF